MYAIVLFLLNRPIIYCSRSEEQMGNFPFFQANDIQNYILQNDHKDGCHGIKAIGCLLINI